MRRADLEWKGRQGRLRLTRPLRRGAIGVAVPREGLLGVAGVSDCGGAFLLALGGWAEAKVDSAGNVVPTAAGALRIAIRRGRRGVDRVVCVRVVFVVVVTVHGSVSFPVPIFPVILVTVHRFVCVVMRVWWVGGRGVGEGVTVE